MFRPLNEENAFPEVDWSEIVDSLEDSVNDGEEIREEINTSKSDNKDKEDTEKTLESLREAASNIVDKVEDRFEEDVVTYTKAVKTFVKKTTKIVSANDRGEPNAKILFSFRSNIC